MLNLLNSEDIDYKKFGILTIRKITVIEIGKKCEIKLTETLINKIIEIFYISEEFDIIVIFLIDLSIFFYLNNFSLKRFYNKNSTKFIGFS